MRVTLSRYTGRSESWFSTMRQTFRLSMEKTATTAHWSELFQKILSLFRITYSASRKGQDRAFTARPSGKLSSISTVVLQNIEVVVPLCTILAKQPALTFRDNTDHGHPSLSCQTRPGRGRSGDLRQPGARRGYDHLVRLPLPFLIPHLPCPEMSTWTGYPPSGQDLDRCTLPTPRQYLGRMHPSLLCTFPRTTYVVGNNIDLRKMHLSVLK